MNENPGHRAEGQVEWIMRDGSKIPITDARRFPRSAILLRCLGAVIICCCWLPWYLSPEWLERPAAFVLGPGTFGLGLMCLSNAQRMTARPIHEVLANDPRPPILYLRSFGDDLDMDKMRLYGIINTTYERLIADPFKDYGPVVAIGRPGEKLPLLGAARIYVHDDDWFKVVTDFMSRAQVVILRVGETDGLRRELEAAADGVKPQQLILFMPFKINWKRSRQEQYDAFRLWATDVLKRPLPPSVADSCLIYFDESGQACLLTPYRKGEASAAIDHPLAGALTKIAAEEMLYTRF